MFLPLLLLLLIACGDAAVPTDAAPSDASTMDARADAATGEDGGTFADAASSDAAADAGGEACSVSGRPGGCIDVADCDGDRVATPGFCPGPANIQCCTAPVAGSCDPSAMPTPNDGLVEEAGDPGCPAGMARVSDFCMDRYEAALVELDGSGAEIGSWSPFFNPGTRRMRADSMRDAVPQGHVSGTQAAAACAEAGKRLCSDTEWLRACQGSPPTSYPYGDTRMDGVCNDARTPHPAVEYFGTSDDWIWSMLDHPCISQLPDSIALTGQNASCVTGDGVYDLMGNLHEWTNDPAGTFRGGFYVDTRINGEGCLYRTTAHSMGHWDYSTGFRCCSDGS